MVVGAVVHLERVRDLFGPHPLLLRLRELLYTSARWAVEGARKLLFEVKAFAILVRLHLSC